MRRTPLATVLASLVSLPLLLTVVALGPAEAGEREDATWTETYLEMPDGTVLHADVLRSVGLADDVRTPVVLTVSPYTSHSGGAATPDPTGEPPSERFYDFLDLTGALDEGYTYVMVDLPGTGGSGGCNDWGGPAEQGAVEAAVEWAADQPWSTGKVALLGKSYDAWTGLMGVSRRPEGLAAVISMEPVFSGYSYLYNRGVRFANSVGTPVIFQANDLFPGSLADSPDYQLTGAPLTPCHALNIVQQQDDVEESAFWAERDMVPTSRGSRLPVLLTQGFLETNTKPDRAFDYWSGLRGRHNIGWFGQFDHVRGWETDGEGRSQVGRDPKVFTRQVEAFLDKHLLGGAAARCAPPAPGCRCRTTSAAGAVSGPGPRPTCGRCAPSSTPGRTPTTGPTPPPDPTQGRACGRCPRRCAARPGSPASRCWTSPSPRRCPGRTSSGWSTTSPRTAPRR